MFSSKLQLSSATAKLLIICNIRYCNVLNKILCMLTAISGLLFIMCDHCSPVVVWYNYHGINEMGKA